MEAEQELVLLRGPGDLDDGDGEAVGGRGKHSRGQGHIVLVQELWEQVGDQANEYHNYQGIMGVFCLKLVFLFFFCA